jgi:hypothetical protein
VKILQDNARILKVKEEKESHRWLETMREAANLLPEGQEALHTTSWGDIIINR